MLQVLWECRCQVTSLGDLLLLVGSSEELGSWQPERGIPLSTDALSFPLWRTAEIALDQPITVEYKFVIRRANGAIEWETFSGNRTADLRANAFSHIENVWNSLATASITCFPLRPDPKNQYTDDYAGAAAAAAAAAGAAAAAAAAVKGAPSLETAKTGFESVSSSLPLASGVLTPPSRGGEVHKAESSGAAASLPYSEAASAAAAAAAAAAQVAAAGPPAPADEAGGGGAVRAPLNRSAFIIANSGPISDYYIMDKTIGAFLPLHPHYTEIPSTFPFFRSYPCAAASPPNI
ncbi:Calcium-dependent protein kinase, related, related [Eimeria brunetti]|uniref:Calcium-dependent protein kinase, related, related n=1 Tax=Eimeria brunetti TaxID=51314 RepID=U6LJ85_9EIME|nr:Calcium-dependent protein kinase, related, related [Eimeria brunetti]